MVRDKEESKSNNLWIPITNKTKHSFKPALTKIPPSTRTITAKGDSGASNHYFALSDIEVLNDTEETTDGIEVILPTADTVKSTKTGYLPFANLSKKATKTEVFPALKHSLISLGQLCDDGCLVLLHKQKLLAAKNGNIVLTGDRNHIDKLWDIPVEQKSTPKQTGALHLPKPKPHSLNVIIRKDKTKADLV